MNQPAHANSPKRIADPEKRAEAEAISARRVSGWEVHWARLLERDERWMAGEKYLEDCELRDRPAMPGSQTSRVDCSGREPVEEARIIRADRIAAVEKAILTTGPLMLRIWKAATIEGLTAKVIAERHLSGHSTKALRNALGANSQASRRDIQTRYVRKRIEVCGELAAEALRG